MSVSITPELQTYINWLESDSRITAVTVDNVPSDYLPMLPMSIANPLFFSISLNDPSINKSGTAKIILPDIYYGQPPQPGWQPPIDQLWPLTNFDNPNTFGLELDSIIAYADPTTRRIHPLFGFSNIPEDFNKADGQLKELVLKLSTVTNTVTFYKYLSTQVLQHLDTDEAYYGYCYFGTDTFTTYLGGKDAIGVAVIKAHYLSTSTHQVIVDYVADRIKEYKDTK